MADTVHGKTVYNSILNRWIFGTTADGRKSSIFKDGYDDPTYMTFKIEFGEWGASILDRSIVQNGITEFGLTFNDYDQLPVGLLNCPYEGSKNQDVYWQTGVNSNYQVFNKTKIYSAFQYLRSRNEDTRAKYLYYFVNGLYEIQHDYPYIFKKISGINELDKFDPVSGQRLKTPAKITLECYEGLDLKIRTLMEFYRKAAWDDVYQRWILPENMREFKMIIYVFERRVFQDVEMFDVNGKKQMKMSFGKLNADIPVKAYECMPCEFSIGDSMSWNGDYSSSTENNEETSKLVIQVKNVKTYFKNNLFNNELSKIYNNNGSLSNNLQERIDSIMIYDLVEEMERNNGNVNEANNIEEYSSTQFTNLTVNGAKASFLDKRVLLENEEGNLNIKSYVWGHSAGGAFYGSEEEAKLAISKSNQQLIGLSEHDTGHNEYQRMVESYADYYMLEDNEFYRGGWIYSLASGPTYDPHKSFWGNLGDNIKNVLTGMRRLVLMSGAANLQIIPNCLIDSYYIQPDVFDTLSDSLNPVKKVSKPSDIIQSEYAPEYDYKNLGIQDSLNPIKNVSTSHDPIQSEYALEYDYANLGIQDSLNPVLDIKKNPRKPIQSEYAPEYDYKNLNIQDSLNPVLDIEKDPKKPIVSQHDMKYYRDRYWVHNKSENPVNEVKEPSDPIISKKDAQYNYDNNEYRYLPVDDKLNELSYVKEPSDSIQSKSDQKYSYENLQPKNSLNPVNEVKEPSDPIYSEKESQYNYQSLKDEREIPSQQFNEIIDDREIPEQKFAELNPERELKSQQYKELDKERTPDAELIDLLLIARSLPGFKDMPIEDIRKIPKQDLLELKDAKERSMPAFKADKSVLIESVKDIEGTNMKLLELDKDNKTLEEQALQILKQNQALSKFKLSETDKESPDEKAEKLKKLTIFTKDFVENSDKVKQAYVKNILELKDNLKKSTIKIINSLPQNDTYILNKDEKDTNINSVLASQNDIDQINHNMKYLAIKDSDIEKLSFQTLIQLHEELGDAIQRSQAVEGLTAITKNSVATNPDEKIREKAKHSVIEEPKKKKMTVIY